MIRYGEMGWEIFVKGNGIGLRGVGFVCGRGGGGDLCSTMRMGRKRRGEIFFYGKYGALTYIQFSSFIVLFYSLTRFKNYRRKNIY